VDEILREFYALRLKLYQKRKAYMEGVLGAEAAKLSNQARFILEKCDNTLTVENKKKKVMMDELRRRGYDSDPVKAWKKAQVDLDESRQEEEDEAEEALPEGQDYDYLLGMKMWCLTEERKNEILKQRDDKEQELQNLKAMSKEQLWLNDLDAFLAKLDEVEQKEREEDAGAVEVGGAGKKKKAGGGKKGALKVEAMPSPMGIRVEPRIADELKIKVAKAAIAKQRKENKEEKKSMKNVLDDKDEFDAMLDDKEMNKSLSDRLGNTPEKKKLKQTKLKFEKSTPPKKKGRNPWSDDSEGDDDSKSDQSDVVDEPIIPREKPISRRAATAKKYVIDDSEESESDGSEDMFDNDGVQEAGASKPKAMKGSDDSDASEPEVRSAPPPKPAAAAKPKPKPKVVSDSEEEEERPAKSNGVNGHSKDDMFDVSDSDSEDDFAARVKAKAVKPPPKKLVSSEDLFDSMLGEDDKKKPAPKKKVVSDSGSDSDGSDFKPAAKKKKPPPKKKKAGSDSDGEAAPKPKKKAAAPKPKPAKPAPPKKKKVVSDSDSDAPKAKKAKGKKKKGSDSDSDLDFEAADIGPARDRPGRARQPVSYAAGDDSDESDSDF